MANHRQEVLERVRRVLRDTFLNDDLIVAEDTNLADIPEWDSELHVTLVLALEHEFNVRLTAREASRAVAIRPILDLLESKNDPPRRH